MTPLADTPLTEPAPAIDPEVAASATRWLRYTQEIVESGWLEHALVNLGPLSNAIGDEVRNGIFNALSPEAQERVRAYRDEVRRQAYNRNEAYMDVPTLRTAYLAAVGSLHAAPPTIEIRVYGRDTP